VPAARTSVLVGGVAELFQGDLDLGRRAVEALAAEGLGEGVLVEELSYGAVAVAQRLEDVRPGALILVGAAARGRRAGIVERRELRGPPLSAEEAQLAVGDAVTGYVSIDLVVQVAQALGALPPETVAIEVEPASTDVSEELSAEAEAGLAEALELVRAEVRARRAPAA
jgi:hydrogenase maturation protease